MSEQPPTTPGGSGASAPGSAPSPAPSASTAAPASSSTTTGTTTAAGAAAEAAKKAPQELKGFRKALEHTGLPKSVINWKPRLPSRNWCIFLTVVGTVSYIYYDDRKQAKEIRKRYEDAVRPMAAVPLKNTLDLPRKVTVYAARWPEDDESDRGLLYFRKYVKPYLAAAAIDYELVHAPLYGSVARIVRAKVLKARRESLNLNPGDILGPVEKTDKERELERQADEGGVVLMGRPTMKEYMAGLTAGWSNGVSEWVWEDSVKSTLGDEPFADPPAPPAGEVVLESSPEGTAVAATPVPAVPTGAGVQHVGLPNPAAKLSLPPVEDDEPVKKSWWSGLFGHGGRKAPSPSPQTQTQTPEAPQKFSIPPNWHEPPTPLPPHAPVLLVDWCNHLGFKQIPYMIYDFFTEHKRVKAGAEAAYALITEQVRAFEPPSVTAEVAVVEDAEALHEGEAIPSAASIAGHQGGDLDFDTQFEKYYKKDYAKTPEEIGKEREKYYDEKLPKRVEAAKAFARGEREITPEEQKSDKPVETVQMLRDERNKKELRWEGNLEGWSIVKPDTPVAWDPRFAGWLKVYQAAPESLDAVMNVPEKNGESRLE
ncbi:hypothetical protein A1Q2_03402 [Trichosporon asahii var. asahii CBS 8904]|uniref:Mitochondrial import inner membrane translocase subunit TIM54 n=1 Tax=Trichosporon asahii var. asahii (strain CBS 8904) TaxID=1220162 RepID=K1VE36_TRIAC|nr:hypothetical protein A1Q2_03402 [Trichosporon asahii var. asahii CBS 8904]